MLRPLIVPALAIASFVPLGFAHEALIPVKPAIYHPGLDHQTWVVQVDYNHAYRAQRHHRRAYYRNRRHRRHEAVKRIGLGAAGGAVIGGLVGHGKGALAGAAIGGVAGAAYNHHENEKDARRY